MTLETPDSAPSTPPSNAHGPVSEPGAVLVYRSAIPERGRQFLRHLVMLFAGEPPLRTVIWFFVYLLPVNVRWKAFFRGAARLAHYLVGVLAAADQARERGIKEISVVEFGVAYGAGLRVLEKHADAVERETGVKVSVFGFDSGGGLPSFIGDYRDHPDAWRPGDYSMAGLGLAEKLAKRTRLILGDVRETVPRFVAEGTAPPIGFVAFDLDLYSSTRDALQVLTLPGKNTLPRVFMYFDDISQQWSHSFAGERLAIREFNDANDTVKIDQWYDVNLWRPFSDKQPRLRQMFIAHDLEAASRTRLV